MSYVTKDETLNLASGGWNAKITYPADKAAQQAIIFMVGLGEVGQGNFGGLLVNGSPHNLLNNGWDGSVTGSNGNVYPILISISPFLAWPSTRSAGEALQYLKKTYNITDIHVTGLSMGAMTWGRVIGAEQSKGDETYMKMISSAALLQGSGDAFTSPSYMLGGDLPVGSKPFESFGIWGKKYGGRLFAVAGTNDFSGLGGWQMTEAMNALAPGSAFFTYESIGGGNHCCWSTMYDPKTNTWTTASWLAKSTSWDGTHGSLGTYKEGHNIFQWAFFDKTASVDVPVIPPPVGPTTRIQAKDFISHKGGQFASNGNEGVYLAGMSQNGTVDYSVNLPSGLYTINFRTASPQSAVFQLFNGVNLLGQIALQNTGDWSKWTTSSIQLNLPALTTITIKCLNKETANFNWFEFLSSSIVTADAGPDQVVNYPDPVTLDGKGGTWSLVSSVLTGRDIVSVYRLTSGGTTDDVTVTVKNIPNNIKLQ